MATKLIPGKNDLATINPFLAKQWDDEANLDIKPTMVSAGSSKKVGWICEKGHRWLATVASRNAGAGCPICAREANAIKIKNNLLQKNGSLAIRNPVLASEWHPTKNGNLIPQMVTPNTHEVVWWLGKCGHEWMASVKTRNSGHGCPYCNGKKIMQGFNDLQAINPTLAKEWHPDRNGNLQPCQVSPRSSKIVWWKCEKGHEWMASIKSRSKGNGCPICSGEKTQTDDNNLISRFPQIASEWHPTKNGDVTPNQIAPGSHKKIWWRCANGHEWQASPNHRTSKARNCPFCCANPQVLPGTNDLASRFPDLSEEWHPTKNGDLTPDMITANSSRRVWWKCSKGHEWKTAVNHRANGSQCPICSGGMQSSFPEQAIYYYVKAAYPDAINGYTDLFHNHGMELDIYVPSLSLGIEYDGSAWHKGMKHQIREDTKYRICKENGIVLIRIREDIENVDISTCDTLLFVQDNLNTVINELKKYLPLLSGINVERDESLIKSSFLKNLNENSLSVQYPELAGEWHPTKNESLTPEMFLPKSNQKVWWKCNKGHEWQATIDSRVRGTGCPYCSNNKILSGYNDLASKRPDLMKEWNWQKNTSIDPTRIAPGSGKKACWICSQGHEWMAEISSRNKGHGCPFCARITNKHNKG